MQPASIFYAWDDPDSKIQFLEETLRGKDWRVTLLYPDHTDDSAQKRAAAKAALAERGYLVEEGEDDCGHYTLSLHHLAGDSSPSELMHELGLAKGVRHMGAHPMLPLRYLLRAGQQSLSWIEAALHDPAKANGLFNLVAESFLMRAGWGTREGHIGDTKNWLQSLAGTLFFAQSFIYLFVAKDNQEVALDHFEKKVHATQKAGGDITQIHFDPERDKPQHGIGSSITRFLRRYPVQIGALFNDLGMIAYLGHVHYARQWEQNVIAQSAHTNVDKDRLARAKHYVSSSYKYDYAGGLFSLVAWPLLMLPRKHLTPAEEEAHEGHPLHKLWDHFRANPEHAAGALTLGASSMRLFAAGVKDNPTQKIGERIYILGDLALMLTKNDDYGSDNAKNLGALAEKLAQYVEHQPVVLGPASQKQMVEHMANYLLEKNLAEGAEKGKHPQFTRAQLDERAAHLAQEVMLKLGPAENLNLQRLADAAIHIGERFPASIRPQVIARLTDTLSGMPWVHASKEELQAAFNTSLPTNASRQSQLVQMKDISREVAELAFVVPGLDAGATAAAIYDALAPVIRTLPSDKQQLSQAMIGKAREGMGLTAPAPQAGLTR